MVESAPAVETAPAPTADYEAPLVIETQEAAEAPEVAETPKPDVDPGRPKRYKK